MFEAHNYKEKRKRRRREKKEEEKKGERRRKRKKKSAQEMCGTPSPISIKIYIMERKEKGTESIFEEIVFKIILNLTKDMTTHLRSFNHF